MQGPFHFGYFDLSLVQAATALGFRESLVARLLAESSIVSIVDPASILPGMIPELEHLPALVYRISDTDRGKVLGGFDGMTNASVKLFASSTLASDCAALAKALRNAFDGFMGSLGSVRVYFARVADEEDDYLENVDGSNSGTFVTTVTINFKYREPLPTLT